MAKISWFFKIFVVYITILLRSSLIDAQVCMRMPCGIADCGQASSTLSHSIECETSKERIPFVQYRDGKFDCPDGTDEACCRNQEYQCDLGESGLPSCFDKSVINDGTFDCNDFSDETNFIMKECNSLRQNLTEAGVFECTRQAWVQGPPSKCIPKALVGDGNYDCPLGDDELPCNEEGSDTTCAGCQFEKLATWKCPGR